MKYKIWLVVAPKLDLEKPCRIYYLFKKNKFNKCSIFFSQSNWSQYQQIKQESTQLNKTTQSPTISICVDWAKRSRKNNL